MQQQKFYSGAKIPTSTTYVVFDEIGHNLGSIYLTKNNLFPPTNSATDYFLKSE
ncbi:MAG: hypothetical protein MJ149_00510 [Clostridia bacterium]|nr:hypothetical protein [Clostridia bacterium]MCQ2564280.1 hypothetical protein [Clostridia bacterium]